MDCKNQEIHINEFLNRTLSGDELRNFLMHVKKCPDCMEELGTSYLLDVALDRIENGESVNLESELNLRLEGASKAMLHHWFYSNTFRSIEVVAGIMLALGMVRSFIIYVIPHVSGLI